MSTQVDIEKMADLIHLLLLARGLFSLILG